jgi:hypothetical protein
MCFCSLNAMQLSLCWETVNRSAAVKFPNMLYNAGPGPEPPESSPYHATLILFNIHFNIGGTR